jgi:predicted RNA-binding protein with TRAM domain
MRSVVPEQNIYDGTHATTEEQMKISEDLLCIYSASVTEQNDSYVVEVPKREVALGSVETGTTYRVALVSPTETQESGQKDRDERPQQPPLDEGDIREVEIEDMGDQGDGIARVDRGYVVIVPDVGVGDRVTVRIKEARENVAFAEVVRSVD